MIPSVEMHDPKPTSDNPASSEENGRTIGKWFRKVMTKRSPNRTPRQTPSEASPQSGIPSQTKATPPTEKPSTMAPGKRQQVSVPSCVDTGHGYLTTWLSGRLDGPPSDRRFVHASYPFTDILVTSCASQKQKPPKTAPHSESEASRSNVPNETKSEPSGAQNKGEVRIHLLHLAACTHDNSSSQVNRPGPLRVQKLGPPMFAAKRKLRLLVPKTTSR